MRLQGGDGTGINFHHKIRVNALLPGAHDTPMTRQVLADEPEAAAAITRIEKLGKPKDVAVLLLASDESRQITGAAIVIDNGATMK